MKEICAKHFANGSVYLLETSDGFPVEVTDTFLPYYTKHATNYGSNRLVDYKLGDRSERWMVGISCMSGCPVRCKFCATGQLKKWRALTAEEMEEQVLFILNKNRNVSPVMSKEFKINYTRMGEPFLNIVEVKRAIGLINYYTPFAHHYISTIGIRGSDFNWIEGNITLQLSLHSLNESRRNVLIPYVKKMSIEELGKVRTKSNLKTTINMTLIEEKDFDIGLLKKFFDPKYFFIKLSPINVNPISNSNNLGNGIIKGVNIV